MPLPKPEGGENREDFMTRCIQDDKTTEEFPSMQQRVAVCGNLYDNKEREMEVEEDAISDVLFADLMEEVHDAQANERVVEAFKEEDDGRTVYTFVVESETELDAIMRNLNNLLRDYNAD